VTASKAADRAGERIRASLLLGKPEERKAGERRRPLRKGEREKREGEQGGGSGGRLGAAFDFLPALAVSSLPPFLTSCFPKRINGTDPASLSPFPLS
jgi:hypothetical protein